jgi:hypothetical protein
MFLPLISQKKSPFWLHFAANFFEKFGLRTPKYASNDFNAPKDSHFKVFSSYHVIFKNNENHGIGN